MLRVPVVAAGVCGTDRRRLAAGYPLASLGHELVAREPSTGRLVGVRPLAPCGDCHPCAQGWSEHCEADAGLGRRTDGSAAFAGHVQVRPDQAYPLPDGLPILAAVLADPLACLLHAVHDLPLADAQVLVVGDGAMAALACLLAHQRQAARIKPRGVVEVAVGA
jgi:L-iditol 2-dehydrogenase